MNIIIAIAMLAVLIVVHELGHFLAAKYFNVYVERFSVGFGKRLVGKRIGETDYCVCAIPLGGYVSMYGEDSSKLEDSGEEFNVPKADLVGRSFADKPAFARAIIIAAGPIANILFTALVFSSLFMSGFPAYDSIVGNVTKGSPAYAAGMVEGEKIIQINDKPVQSWNDVALIVSENAGKPLYFTMENDERLVVTPATTKSQNAFGETIDVGTIGADVYVPPVIGSLSPDFPADKAGLKAGDKILSLDTIPMDTWSDSAAYIRARAGQNVAVSVERNGEVITTSITPQENTITNPDGTEVTVGLIGISPMQGNITINYSFVEAIKLGIDKTIEYTELIIVGVGKLITGSVNRDTIGGPIMIVQLAADSASSGLVMLLTFMAVISLNLAIFNLLPVPVLDGGHLLIIAVESITRRKLSEKIVGGFQRAGFALLMLLMVFAFYNDLSRIFFG